MVETASQTDRMVCCCQVREEIEEIEVGEESEREDSDDGSLYEPSGSDSGSDEKRLSEEEEEEEEEEGDGGGSEGKYLVFWTCLLNLFAMVQCGQCGVVANTVRRTVCGTLVRVYHTCLMCGAGRVWCSQPSVRSGAPAGNIQLSAAILSAGALPTKVLRVLCFMGVAIISRRTYFRHQRQLLMPAIHRVWLEHQRWLLACLLTEERPLVFGGDGRSDSMGHSAKYGSYVMMELEANAIIDMKLIQVRPQHHTFCHYSCGVITA